MAKRFDQEAGVDFIETFSHVVKPLAIRMVLALAVQFDWCVTKLDVSNAFLTDEIYMEQPPRFVDPQFPNYVCRLYKSLYGLKQAPHAWFTRLSQSLLELGFLSSSVDPLFIFHKDNIHIFFMLMTSWL